MFDSNIPWLVFCLDGLSTAESEVLNSTTKTVLLSICPFRPIRICLMYLGALMLDSYIFATAIST